MCLHSKSKYIVSRFFEFGSKDTVTVHAVWNGTHDRHGIFLAWDNGGDIAQGKKISAKVEDVTPTILHLYNLQIPEDMDGRVLKGIFRERSHIKERGVEYKPKNIKNKTKNIIQRLKTEGKI